ncbi:MAG: pyridoxamine 5'-phosphate oxidase family protein [Chitinophagales bacterium]|nr:pyridoxamine 5'-phosphate oxidase family protein [Chitinophagales bacterium]
MLGELAPDQIEKLLSQEMIGRIGCSANGLTYVVPVTFAYEAGYIYALSKEGMKIQMMRQNPMVCFEVDSINDLTNWKSVIAWGTFEELKDTDQKMGLKKLISKFEPDKNSETALPKYQSPHKADFGQYKTIIFRIKLLEKTGRFEKR